jgi:hypothetical protein
MFFGLNDVAFLAAVSGPAGPTDPFFANVSLLLHGDGPDGSTSIIDSSPSPKTVTAVGDAKISTAQSKFGGASIAFDGIDSYLNVPSVSSTTLGASDFTVELWVYPTANTGELLFWNANAGAFGLRLNLSNRTLFFLASLTGASHFVNAGVTSLTINTWTHLAISRYGSVLDVYKNGTRVYQATTFTGTMVEGSQNIIGARTVSPTFFPGYIDELRITKGVARYQSAFTPPTAPFPDA